MSAALHRRCVYFVDVLAIGRRVNNVGCAVGADAGVWGGAMSVVVGLALVFERFGSVVAGFGLHVAGRGSASIGHHGSCGVNGQNLCLREMGITRMHLAGGLLCACACRVLHLLCGVLLYGVL